MATPTASATTSSPPLGSHSLPEKVSQLATGGGTQPCALLMATASCVLGRQRPGPARLPPHQPHRDTEPVTSMGHVNLGPRPCRITRLAPTTTCRPAHQQQGPVLGPQQQRATRYGIPTTSVTMTSPRPWTSRWARRCRTSSPRQPDLRPALSARSAAGAPTPMASSATATAGGHRRQ